MKRNKTVDYLMNKFQGKEYKTIRERNTMTLKKKSILKPTTPFSAKSAITSALIKKKYGTLK